YGNASLDEDGNLIKVPNEGVLEEVWDRMKAYAAQQGWKAGNFKKLNLPFENQLLGQPRAGRERMIQRVKKFDYGMLVDVFNAADTAPLAIEAIRDAGGFDPGPKARRIESPEDWTVDKIRARAAALDSDKGPEGDFED
ncbi:MAG TPA: ketose-bisphosphate aldolase, partial [Desulfosarcina sp.]|nr:ketose-bisphosphate aldolase [Desulfosarcina sp.]